MRKHPLLNISFRTLFDWCKKIENPLAVLSNLSFTPFNIPVYTPYSQMADTREKTGA